MKQKLWLLLPIIGVLCLFGQLLLQLNFLTANVRSSQPFMFEAEEWNCAYTPRQVDIKILEEQIAKLKGE